MALPYSGQISLGNIANEQGVSLSNVSLRARSASAGKGTPDAISEFYGYSSSTVWTHATQIWGPGNRSASGTVRTYKAGVTFTLTNFGGITGGGTAYSVLFMTTPSGTTTIQTTSIGAYQSSTATTTQPTAGTYTSQLYLYSSGQGTSTAAYARVTAV